MPRTSNFRSGARSGEGTAVWSQVLELSGKGGGSLAKRKPWDGESRVGLRENSGEGPVNDSDQCMGRTIRNVLGLSSPSAQS